MKDDYTVSEPTGEKAAAYPQHLKDAADRLFGEVHGLMRALNDEDPDDAWYHAKEIYDLSDRILDEVRYGGDSLWEEAG